MGFSGPLLRRAVMTTIGDKLFELAKFESQFQAIVQAAEYQAPAGHADKVKAADAGLRDVVRRKANIVAAVSDMGALPELKEELASLTQREVELTMWRCELDRLGDHKCRLPATLLNLRAEWDTACTTLGEESAAFAELLRTMTPTIHTYFVRMCDGPNMLARALVSFDLLGDYPDAAKLKNLASLSKFTTTIDLFIPPQRERIREEVVRLQRSGIKLEDICNQIAERPNYSAVQYALHIQTLMERQGLTTPYILIGAPPPENRQLRRYRSVDYKFTPVAGYVRPDLI